MSTPTPYLPSRWRLPGRAAALIAGLATSLAGHAALDLQALWDYSQPALSQQRLQAALATASGDERLVLQTQIARSHGLRRQFDEARRLLAEVAPRLDGASDMARAHYFLELGRTWVSATHRLAEITPAARQAARDAYTQALRAARAAQQDDLAIDALHMMPFVDTDLAAQLRWNQQALALQQASSQPAAQRWASPLRNNTGYVLHQLGRYDEALALFQANVAQAALPGQKGNPTRHRIARWMVAWTLRALQRLDEALALQLTLEQENQADGTPDAYVFEELEQLYRAKADTRRAAHYAGLLKASRGGGGTP